MTKPSEPAPSQHATRALGSAVCSVFLGGMFGLIAAIGMGGRGDGPLSIVVGSFAGLIASPLLIFALWRGPWLSGIPLIAVPTAIAAFIGGLLTPPHDGSFVSLALALLVYSLASFVRGIMPSIRARGSKPGVCVGCGYSRRGLPPNAPCPECGLGSTLPMPPP